MDAPIVPAVPVESDIRFCALCGKTRPDGAAFCPTCGTPFAPASIVPSGVARSPSGWVVPAARPKPRSLLPAVVLVLFVALVVGVILLVSYISLESQVQVILQNVGNSV